MDRLDRATAERQAQEGFALALETVAALREMRGVSGVHLISIKGQESILRLIEAAGLLPRPAVEWSPDAPMVESSR